LPEFVEWAGKNPYKCPDCKAPIRYAKFFGSDKKILTLDGKPPNKKFGKDSNTGWPTDPETKQMHECAPKDIPESELKISNTLDSGWIDNSQTQKIISPSGLIGPFEVPQLTDIDKKVRDRMIEDAYVRAKFLIWKLQGVEKACKELGIQLGPQSGMVFNQVCAEDRSVRQNGE